MGSPTFFHRIRKCITVRCQRTSDRIHTSTKVVQTSVTTSGYQELADFGPRGVSLSALCLVRRDKNGMCTCYPFGFGRDLEGTKSRSSRRYVSGPVLSYQEVSAL